MGGKKSGSDHVSKGKNGVENKTISSPKLEKAITPAPGSVKEVKK